MPGDIQDQLAVLRRRITRVDRRFALKPPVPEPAAVQTSYLRPARYQVEEWLSGEEVRTRYGCHFETERLYESHRRHGSIDVSSLHELPSDLLEAISKGEVRNGPPSRWAFLDTETTGLAGGAGTYAFLIGVGRITAEGFRLRQFFMRDLSEEASLLFALSEHLGQFDTLVTYNGKAYDLPLIETRYRMARMPGPFGSIEHLDLLFGARRLWKLKFDNCRLVELENRILGFEREGDIPGEMIPYVYFEYLRRREAWRVAPILHHNAMDILTLACLTAIVPWAFKNSSDPPLTHGAEMVGLARWLRQAERFEDALKLFRRAVDRGLNDDLLFRTLYDIGMMEKKLGRCQLAVAAFQELATCRNGHRLAALEELAKHYEHRERDYAEALVFVKRALDLEDTPVLRRRAERLTRRLHSRTKQFAQHSISEA